VHVGTFGAPVGLKGEIRINCLTKTIQVFKSLNEYFNFDKSTQWKFDKMLIRNNKLLVHPSGFNNRNDVELLINKKIYSYENNFSEKVLNNYSLHDLLNCKIKSLLGENIGNVISIENFGAGDLIETNYKNKNIYIPLNYENIVSVDLEKKTITINPMKGILD
tara:strand:- start:215 stop:703 length:489 start_codon:yes stop_codon:yes gene_type:complete